MLQLEALWGWAPWALVCLPASARKMKNAIINQKRPLETHNKRRRRWLEDVENVLSLRNGLSIRGAGFMRRCGSPSLICAENYPRGIWYRLSRREGAPCARTEESWLLIIRKKANATSASYFNEKARSEQFFPTLSPSVADFLDFLLASLRRWLWQSFKGGN